MLSVEKIEQIERLGRNAALSLRAIAKKVGVSAETVNRVLARVITSTSRAERRKKLVKRTAELPRRSRTYHHCPGCGGTVQMPCLLCELKAMGESEGEPSEYCVECGGELEGFMRHASGRCRQCEWNHHYADKELTEAEILRRAKQVRAGRSDMECRPDTRDPRDKGAPRYSGADSCCITDDRHPDEEDCDEDYEEDECY